MPSLAWYMYTCMYSVHVLGVLCCFALFVCLTLLASFFLPSHLSFKNMYWNQFALYPVHVYPQPPPHLFYSVRTAHTVCVCDCVIATNEHMYMYLFRYTLDHGTIFTFNVFQCKVIHTYHAIIFTFIISTSQHYFNLFATQMVALRPS